MSRAGRFGLVAVWATAEATIWPLMPDATLLPLAVDRPADWWRLALASAAGSLAGGAVSYAIGRTTRPDPLLGRLPLVRPAMVRAAQAWLTAEGAGGLRHQPLSGLPYKVFALVAGAQRVPLGPFLGWTLIARGTRFLAVSGLGALLGLRFERLVRRHPLPLLLLWSLAFLLGLRRMVAAWEHRTTA